MRTVALDVTSKTSIEAAAADAVARLGGFDILADAAARTGGHGGKPDNHRSAGEDGMIADTAERAMGSLRLARAAEPHLRAAGEGRIPLFGGGAGQVRGGLVSAGARNRALDHLTVTPANALGPYGIGVVCLAPGSAVAARQPAAHARAAQVPGTPPDACLAARADRTTLMRRLVMAGDLAKLAGFLCAPASWPINAALVELSGGSSPDIRHDLDPRPPREPGTNP